ncbi:MAG TPA: glutaminase A [Nocardioidaceae bacterium]|nr:glutaminase A [Nocardioidaceae bacterium]
MGSVVQDLIGSVLAACAENRSGDILRGIPALEDVDPDTFGICLATADGHIYEVGDSGLPFCIQSISKPFTYGIALTDNGIDLVDAKIDVEPSGELYNEISLHPVTHRPRNPMINAGALVAASLVAGATPEEQIERIGRTYSMYAGRELALDEDIFASQLESGHRNRAIGHMLREFGILEGNPDIVHDIYLRACSTMVTCRDLSMMGATLANGGVNPVTGERVLAGKYTERVLSVMSTCGMYDAAGAWFAQVGLAAKSGVGGGIVAVLPGQLSIAAFSPRLDDHGNSVRAFEACRRLSRDLELHELHVARAARSAIRASYDVMESPSAVWRPEADRRLLDEHGRKARIYEAHGDLLFGGVESVVREISEACHGLDLVVLDVRRVGEVAEVSRRLLADLCRFVRDQGCEVVLIDPDGLRAGTADGDDVLPTFATVAAAIVWCEDWLIERYGGRRPAEERYRFRDHPLFAQATPRVVDELERRMQPCSFADGELIVAERDTDAGVFLTMRGRVRCSLTTTDGITRHLATLTPGTCFGEVYLMADGPHPFALHADGPVEVFELTRDEFAKIGQQDSELWAAIVAIFMSALRNDLDRALRSLAAGRMITR